MELKIKEITFPERIAFNFEELKKEITEKAALYKNIAYTDETIKEAKADKAALNKFVTALEDKRKEVKKHCLEPYETFEKQIKELVAIIKEPVELIDSQVKDFEQRKKDEKLEKIKEFWELTQHPDWLTCNQIFDQKWLNASVSLKKVQDEITEKLCTIQAQIHTIETLPEFSFEALEEYKRTLDINKAITEGQRLADIQKRKLEIEKARAEEEARKEQEVIEVPEEELEPVEEVEQIEFSQVGEEEEQKQWVKFAAHLTVTQAKALKAYCDSQNIILKSI